METWLFNRQAIEPRVLAQWLKGIYYQGSSCVNCVVVSMMVKGINCHKCDLSLSCINRIVISIMVKGIHCLKCGLGSSYVNCVIVSMMVKGIYCPNLLPKI